MFSNFKTQFLFLLFNLVFSFLFSQTYTFTTAGATGRSGPTQLQLNTTYGSTNLNSLVTTTNGIQSWTVPYSGVYRVEAYGARGGNGSTTTGGVGAKMQGDFTFSAGQILKILVGQSGGSSTNGNVGLTVGGGGGGSYVSNTANQPLIVAGGSGGLATLNMYSFGMANNAGNSGTSGMPGSNGNLSVTASSGGINGNGGSTATTFTIGQGSGGGGFFGNGANGNPATGGRSFTNGGQGGLGTSSSGGSAGDGGFGGGGGGDWSNNTGAGGGGGYSGGGGGTHFGLGGGGGSYNSGANQLNTGGFNNGDGYVIVTRIAGLDLVQTSSISCNGQLTAALTASAFGGAGPYSYSWTPSVSNSSIAIGLGGGNYTCVVTDANAVSFTSTFVVSEPALLVSTLSQTNVSCFGNANGILQVNVSGGSLPYTYSWSPMASASPSLNNLSPGTYTCLVSDAKNCTTTLTAAVTQPAAVTVSVAVTNPTICYGQTSMLSGSGASSYSWSHGVSNGVAFTPTITTTYTLTGTAANGCTATAAGTIVVNPTPTVSIAGSNSLCSGSTITLTASGATSYTWNTSSNNTSLSISPIITTLYNVTGSNSFGCENTVAKTISVTPVTVVNAHASSPSVCIGNTVSLYGSGAISYTWTGGINDNVSFAPTISAGYTVNGTGACGTSSAVLNLTVNSLPSVTANATSTLVCSGSTLSLYGSGAQTYTWTGGVNNNAAFPATTNSTYTVTGTDVNGCKNTATTNISINPLPVVTASISSPVICSGASVTLSGSGASTYAWTGGVSNNTSFAPVANTAYTVTGNDLNGCKNTAISSVTIITVPVVTANTTHTSVCYGNTISLYGGGALSYTWAGTVTNNISFSPSVTATYTVFGSNSCFTSSNVITVTVNALPVVTANTTSSIICNGNTITLSGGGADTYTWSGTVVNGVPVSPTLTTTYSVTGTSSLTGCTSTNTAIQTISVNPLPVISINTQTTSICLGDTIGLGFTTADTYTWTGGTSSHSISPQATGTYSVIGTNTLTGCMNSASANFTVNPLPGISVTSTNVIACVGQPVTLLASGGDVYTWTNGVINGQAFYPAGNSGYTVTVTNSLTSCSKKSSVNVVVNSLPIVSGTVSSVSVCYGNSIVFNGVGATTYTWTGGVLNGQGFIPAITNSYSVTGTNTLTGCTSTNASVHTVTVNPLPILSVTTSDEEMCVGETITLTAGGANSYSWSTNETGSSISVTPALTSSYTVYGTDVKGCSSDIVFTQVVSDCLGLKEQNELPFSLTVFPNPNTGNFSISTELNIPLVILNDLGQVVKTISADGSNICTVDDLPNGIYFVVGRKDNQVVKLKIIVMR